MQGYLVEGSQNVLNSTGGRIASRQGYKIYGQRDTTLAGIDSSYDFVMHNGNERNLRAGNGKLEVAYVATAGDKYLTNTFTEGQVYWIPILSGLTTYTKFQFADFWDDTNLKSLLLFVNGKAEINVWTGRNSVGARHPGHSGQDPTQGKRIGGGSRSHSGRGSAQDN